MSKTPFMRKMWVYFRVGHGQYLVYMMALSNFTLIMYHFLIKEIPFLENLLPSYSIFIVIFLPIYLPFAIIIGYGHYKTQIEHDFTEGQKYNKPLISVQVNQEAICKKLGIEYISEENVKVG